MTSATGLRVLPAMLEDAAGSRALDHVFRDAGIPLEIVDEPTAFLPFEGLARIYQTAARHAGDRLFGLRIGGEFPPGRLGHWHEYAGSAPDLRSALDRVRKAVRFHQDGARIDIVRQAGTAIFRYVPPAGAKGSVQHADSAATSLIRFVATYLGPAWRPLWVELPYRRDQDAPRLEAWLGTRIVHEAPGVGLALSIASLAVEAPATRAPARVVTLAEVAAEAGGQRDQTLVGSLRSIVAMRLLAGENDIEGAARLAGMGVQTLQRTLRRDGLTYRRILEDAKLRRAAALLSDDAMPVTEIAISLGYADASNFTRSFKARTGMPPSVYRAARAPRALTALT